MKRQACLPDPVRAAGGDVSAVPGAGKDETWRGSCAGNFLYRGCACLKRPVAGRAGTEGVRGDVLAGLASLRSWGASAGRGHLGLYNRDTVVQQYDRRAFSCGGPGAFAPAEGNGPQKMRLGGAISLRHRACQSVRQSIQRAVLVPLCRERSAYDPSDCQ